jgi:DNA-binding transcriptional LysR family regulator
MALVASPRHRLSTLSQPIQPKDLSQVALVAFAQNLKIRQEIDKQLRQLGVTMRIAVELDNIDSVKHAAIVNSGVAILPKLTVQNEVAAGSLKMLSCEGLNLTRPLGIIQKRDASMSRAARSFMELILSNNVWPGDLDRDGSAPANTESATQASSNGRANVLADAPA